MNGWKERLGQGRWVEPFFATFILLGILYCAWFVYRFGYLPPPFFFEPSDTYADWFNTGFWARNPGAYDVWRTVYPPLSFLFLRIIGLDRCYPDRRSFDASAGLAARDCDWVGLSAIWFIFLINLVLVWLSLRKTDRSTAWPRTVCIALGLPMLDAVERGNLVIISFTFLILCLGPLVRSARWRWVAAGLAVNFKIYLVAAIVPLLLKRRWRWVECALICVVVIYLLSYAAFGHGSPIDLATNIRDFSTMQATNILDVWYSTTYQALVTLLSADNAPMTMVLGSRVVDILAIVLPALQHLAQALILMAIVAIWVRPEPIPGYRVAGLGILLALITTEAGGYSQIYFMFFVMMEPWRGMGRRWAICACYILALPLDIIIDHTPEVVRETYVGGIRTMGSYYVTVGPFLRPFIIMTVGMAMAMVTIREVWDDIRLQGWSERWRFRRDVPMLPWVERPLPPRRSPPAIASPDA